MAKGNVNLKGQNTKPAKANYPRDNDFKDRTLPASATRSYETHPSKGEDVERGTPPVIGKLGK
jgi:hypothetical protein